MTVTPLYRERMMREPSDQKVADEQIHLAQLFHAVLGSPEGLRVLDYICNRLCNVDDVCLSVDPMILVDANARRNVGLAIAALTLKAYDAKKPEVKG